MCQQYDSAVRTVFNFLDEKSMSKTVRKYFRHDAKLLKEYLERGGFEYSGTFAQAWLMGIRQIYHGSRTCLSGDHSPS